jgi:glycosyltransferase involved in cell wall biosynthesis
MKVAIDVHSLGAQAGGNETFYRQLLQGLSKDDSPNQYILLYTRPDAPSVLELDRRFDWIHVPEHPVRRNAFSIPAVLRATKPDVFHCQYIVPLGTGCKTVVTIHDLAHERYPELSPRMEALRMRLLVPWSARRADRIVTVSECSAHDIERIYHIPRDKITVAYQSAEVNFRPRDKAQSRDHIARVYSIHTPFILYVGRVQARKNVPRLIEAFSTVRVRHPNMRLVIVGKPDLHYDKVQKKLRELRLEDAVILPGYVAAEDLPLFYNASEICVFPSIFEGFGLPVMEGLASGVPTLTSRRTSLEEIAGDGALFVDPLNVNSIAEGILHLLENPGLQHELVERGLRRSACFSTAGFAAKILEVYRSVNQS